ncbi:MAG: amylo-alpha-1,6-glucosidase [Nanobdellota archaeon]
MEATTETYQKAIETLLKNKHPQGFSASTDKVANYYSVWARDHSICAIAAGLTGDKELIETAKKGVLYILTKQTDYGQVPSYVEIENKKKMYGGLGQITSIDSNMWIIIAASFLLKITGDKRFVSQTNIRRYKRLYRLLKTFDSNNDYLIEVPRAGDWADIFNRTYHVLYDQCLFYQSMKELLYLFQNFKAKTEEDKKHVNKRIGWVKKRKPSIKRKINQNLWLTKDNIHKVIEDYMIFDKIKEENYNYYLSHIMPFRIGNEKRFDAFGNILAIATNVANKKRSTKIIRYVLRNKINQPVPLRCLQPVVRKRDKDWEPIYAFKERPYTYHNGGIWPMITGFWIYVLEKKGFKKIAEKELKTLAEHLRKDNYQFHEYYHGKTAKPMGRKYQAWSAAGYIIAYNAVYNNISIFQ